MNFESHYGLLDRVLHKIAFKIRFAQQAISDVEEIFYGDVLKHISNQHPLFITALPRSGTTILLKILHQSGHFASHTYQDMPFILCPMFWDRFSHWFSEDETSWERAHGDGIQVSINSPEAFEEMIWKHFWPKHYRSERIVPWTASDHNSEFEKFFETHMRKVIALRRKDSSPEMRYVSKNNLNISRLGDPPSPLQCGTFLIPFREPLQHAASMFNQHRRFLEIHKQDDFVRQYMEAIGHHEFGLGLRPVDFNGWLEDAPDPEDLAFWIRYWSTAYRYILDNSGSKKILLSYANLTEEPEQTLERLADVVDVPKPVLVSQASQLRPPRTHDVDQSSLTQSLLEEAHEIYDELCRKASV